MKENIFEYIQILLPKHQYLSLPSLGAFILNKDEEGEAILQVSAPTYTISFNNMLTHDDGVLTSYIQRLNKISYEAASVEVKTFVAKIKDELLSKGFYQIGSLGRLDAVEGKIVFTQNSSFIHPAFYGLSPIALDTLSTISAKEALNAKKSRKLNFKRHLISVAASAAVIALFFLPISKVEDVSSEHVDRASFIRSLSEPVIENQDVVIRDVSELATTKAGDVNPYMVVLASFKEKSDADLFLTKVQESGLPQAKMILSKDVYRIYLNDFINKEDATAMLGQFKLEQPRYASAWVFTNKKSIY